MHLPAPGVESTLGQPTGAALQIDDGMRIELRPDGTMHQANELLPASVQVRELPHWLRGGFVFWSSVERGTRIWRSHTFTGALQPLAEARGKIQQVVPGFDRLYLWSGPEQALRAVDAETGQPLDLGPLPISSAYGSMAFVTPWFGAVTSDVLGTRVSFDAGLSWHPLGVDDSTLKLIARDDKLELHSNHERWLLDENGTLSSASDATQAPESDPAEDDPDVASPTLSRTTPLGGDPLAVALMHGFKADAKNAIVVAKGNLAEVRLSDGLITRKRALVAGTAPSRCQALRLGNGHGFFCTDPVGLTQLYRYRPQFALTKLLSFSKPRRAVASGTGGLVIEGACTGAGARPGVYCLHDGHKPREIHWAQGGTQRLALLADGTFLALQPAVHKHPGHIFQISNGNTTRHALKLENLTASQRELIETGHWLDPLQELASGELGIWVIGDHQFMGVQLKRDGSLQAGSIRSDLPHALLSGPIGLTIGSQGLGYETTDYGFVWQAFALPSTLRPVDPYSGSIARDERWGCSSHGCALGDWLRVGFGARNEALEAREPKLLPSLNQGLPHWSLHCRATGENRSGAPGQRESPSDEPPLRRLSRRVPNTAPTSFESIANGSWRSFQGVPPPSHGVGQLILDVGNDEYRTQFRGYAWGPRTAAWQQQARWTMRIANRFDVDSVWSTAATRTPWATPITAALAFGQGEQSSELASWSAVLDAQGTAGVIRITTRSGNGLYWVEQDRAIQAIDHPPFNLQKPISTARLTGRRYVAGENDNVFSVYQLTQDRLELLGSYPVLSADTVKVQLVASRAADALAIFVKTADRGWYLFPIDLESGDVSPALQVPLVSLNGVPAGCTPETQGWRLVSDVPLATLGGSGVNAWLGFTAALSRLKAKDIEARVIVAEQGLCLEEVAAQLDDTSVIPTQVETQPGGSTLPIAATLTDRVTERRFGFRCGR